MISWCAVQGIMVKYILNPIFNVSMTPWFNLQVQLAETESLNGNNTSDVSITPRFNLQVQLLKMAKFELKQHLRS
jgi:hypothetical protein